MLPGTAMQKISTYVLTFFRLCDFGKSSFEEELSILCMKGDAGLPIYLYMIARNVQALFFLVALIFLHSGLKIFLTKTSSHTDEVSREGRFELVKVTIEMIEDTVQSLWEQIVCRLSLTHTESVVGGELSITFLWHWS